MSEDDLARAVAMARETMAISDDGSDATLQRAHAHAAWVIRLSTQAACPTGAGEGCLTVPVLKPAYAEEHPLLAPIITKRALAAGDFNHEFSGQRGFDFDRGLMSAFEAVNGELQRMTAALQHKEPGL